MHEPGTLHAQSSSDADRVFCITVFTCIFFTAKRFCNCRLSFVGSPKSAQKMLTSSYCIKLLLCRSHAICVSNRYSLSILTFLFPCCKSRGKIRFGVTAFSETMISIFSNFDLTQKIAARCVSGLQSVGFDDDGGKLNAEQPIHTTKWNQSNTRRLKKTTK